MSLALLWFWALFEFYLFTNLMGDTQRNQFSKILSTLKINYFLPKLLESCSSSFHQVSKLSNQHTGVSTCWGFIRPLESHFHAKFDGYGHSIDMWSLNPYIALFHIIFPGIPHIGLNVGNILWNTINPT